MQQIFIYSPLEQFQVFPILSFYLLGHDFSITNETITFLLVLALTLGFFSSLLFGCRDLCSLICWPILVLVLCFPYSVFIFLDQE